MSKSDSNREQTLMLRANGAGAGAGAGSENTDYKNKKLTCFAVWSVSFVAVASSWQYGFSIGSFNAVYIPMQNVIRQQYETRWNSTVSDSVVEAIWVASSAAFPVGGVFGSFMVGPIVRKFGRLHGLWFTHMITVVFSVFIGLSGVFQSPEILVISRFGIGITSGIVTTGVSVMYVVEVSPQHVRGIFGGLVSGGIAFSLLLGNIFGLPQVFGNEELWPLLLALTGGPSLAFVLLKNTLAYSPRKLFIEDKNDEKATKMLRKLNGIENVDHLLTEMKKEAGNSKTVGQMNIKELLYSRPLRRSLVAALLVGAAQQITGLNGVAFNMNNIYRNAGIDDYYVYYISIGVLSLVVVLNFLGIFLIHKYGRKNLLIFGYFAQGISLVLLTISMETQELSPGMAYVSIAASMGFFVGLAIGPGPVTLLIIAEFFEQNARSAAISLAVVVLWISFALCVIITPYMLASIRGYTFLPYAILSFLAVAHVWFNVPETKNKPFSEIRKSFQRIHLVENNVMIEENNV